MSGRKTTYTTISDDELRSLRNRAARATSLQESNRLLNQLNEQNAAAVADYRVRINAMNQNISDLNHRLATQSAAATKEVRALQVQLQQTVIDSNRRLQALSKENEERVQALHENFTSELTRTREELTDVIDANNRRIEAVMNQNNQRIEAQMQQLSDHMNSELQNVHEQLNDINSSIQTMAHHNDILLEMAQEYENVTQMLLEEIHTNYRVELLCPGRYQNALHMSNNAESQIKDAMKFPANSATARLVANSALEEVYQLYQDVMRAEQEWQIKFEATRQILDTATVQLEASRTIELHDENCAVDVDTWTAGDLSAIVERVESLHNQLKEPAALSISDLDGIQSAGMQISREIDETSMFAIEAFYASQDRGEIAQDIADQLWQSGVSIVGHSYQGNDQRSAHRLHLRNHVTEFEIVITQTPVVQENGVISNRLESDIISYGTLNEQHGDEIARDILSSLSGLGLQQTAVSTVAGFENVASNRVEVTNMQQWRTEQSPEVIKPNHDACKAV